MHDMIKSMKVIIQFQLPTARHRKAGFWVLIKDEYNVTRESIWCHTEEGAIKMKASREEWLKSLEEKE